jgi:hypothetical protein
MAALVRSPANETRVALTLQAVNSARPQDGNAWATRAYSWVSVVGVTDR